VSEPRLSALVVARDEERQLADCLGCLGFADETVVVLDRCGDRSREIALRFTERLVEGAWQREGPRRHAGIEACRGEWVLEIDADERVTPDLAAEIRRVVRTSPAAWHLIPVDNYIGARRVRWGWGASFGRSAHAALFRKGVKRWGDQRVHPMISLSGQQGETLGSRLLHYVDRDVSDMLQRLDRYTTARAQDLRESGDIGSYGQNLRRIVSRFWKCYVGRKGYREGPYGFLIALCAALYPILSYLKARLDPPNARHLASCPGKLEDSSLYPLPPPAGGRGEGEGAAELVAVSPTSPSRRYATGPSLSPLKGGEGLLQGTVGAKREREKLR
jgi:glycosyltransferase involved in cell wall biosynthesis